MALIPRGDNFELKNVKNVFFSKIFFSTPEHRSDKLTYTNDYKERFYQNCKYHDSRGRGSCARARFKTDYVV